MKLFTPGPVEVPAEVLEAGRRVIHHRSSDYHELHAVLQEKLKRLFGLSSGFIAVMAGSGTTAVDAMAWSLVCPGDRVLVIVHGEFGRRLAETLRRRGANVETLESPALGVPVAYEAVAEAVESGGYDAVALVHNETSLGLLASYLKDLAALAAKTDTLLLVDAVSSLAGEELSADWGLAAVASASHKAIAAPPGAALVAVNTRVLGDRGFCSSAPLSLSLERYSEFNRRMETPFTPPVTLLQQLVKALERIEGIGVEKYILMHREKARLLYEQLPQLGLKPVVEDERYRSSTVTAFYTPVNAVELKKRLEKAGFLIAAGMGQLKERMVRIGVMGAVSVEDVEKLVEAVREALRGLR